MSHGPVAQLVEQDAHNVKVIGSIPIRSTKDKTQWKKNGTHLKNNVWKT